MTTRLTVALALALSAAATTASLAQPRPPSPTPAPEPAEKIRARALLKAGNDLSRQGRQREALPLYDDAYRAYPDSRILLSVGKARHELGDLVEAADAYQRFLDDPVRVTDRVPEAEAALAAIDRLVTRVSLVVETTDATAVELAVDDAAWRPLPGGRLLRVAPGGHRVRARGGGVPFIAEAAVDAVAGVAQVVTLRLIVDPPPPPPIVEAPPPPVEAPPPVAPIEPPAIPVAAPTPPRAPGRFGALVHLAIEGKARGAAGSLGVTFAAHPRVTLSAGGIAGPSFGGFAAATVAISTGRLRPTLTGGVPIVVRDGAHVGVRGAAGVEWLVGRRTSVIADIAAEYYPSPGMFFRELMITPTVGVHARL